MSAHLLHLDAIDEGAAVMHMTCEHGVDVERWHSVDLETGHTSPDCWFMSWWEGIGGELVDIKVAPTIWPTPVRPSDDWGYDDGGAIVLDEVTS